MTDASLRRSLSLPLLTLYGVGTMLGAGIFALIGEVAAQAGAAAPWSFAVAAGLAGLTGASFAEFSSRYPKAAGEAVYVAAGFSNARMPVVVGLLIVASGVVSAGVMVESFIGYAASLIPGPGALKLLAAGVVITAVASWGITESAVVIAAITVLEVGALVMVIALGVTAEPVAADVHGVARGGGLGVVSGVVSGAVLAFYAFIGFEDMVNVAEEAQRPRRTMPIAILTSLSVAAALYALVATTAVRVVAIEDLAASREPMSVVFSAVSALSPAWMSAIAIIAIVNGALVQVVMASRVLFGLARQGWLPRWWGVVNARTRTPLRATILVGACVVIAAAALPLAALAHLTSLFLLIVFALVNSALIRVKRAGADAGDGLFLIPIWVPWLGAIATSAFAGLSVWGLVR